MGGVDCVEWTPGLCGNYSVYFAMQAFTCVINAENLANKMGQLCHGVNKNHWIDRRQNDSTSTSDLSVCLFVTVVRFPSALPASSILYMYSPDWRRSRSRPRIQPGFTTSAAALTSIPLLWTLYTKLKLDQRGELGFAIHDDDFASCIL